MKVPRRGCAPMCQRSVAEGRESTERQKPEERITKTKIYRGVRLPGEKQTDGGVTATCSRLLTTLCQILELAEIINFKYQKKVENN